MTLIDNLYLHMSEVDEPIMILRGSQVVAEQYWYQKGWSATIQIMIEISGTDRFWSKGIRKIWILSFGGYISIRDSNDLGEIMEFVADV